jgi:hypothetical protein
LKKNQLGKYIHKYIIAKKKKTSSKNLKITHNEFCGVINDSYICVPAFLDEREKKTLEHYIVCTNRERERVLIEPLLERVSLGRSLERERQIYIYIERERERERERE